MFNLVGCILLLIAGASDGGKDMVGAIVLCPVVTLGSFFLWYRSVTQCVLALNLRLLAPPWLTCFPSLPPATHRPIYWAYSKESAVLYYLYFAFAGVHIAFSTYMAVGIPSSGSAGLINTIQTLAQGHIVAGV